MAPFPAVTPDTPAIDAARLLAGQDLPGLIIVDDFGRPLTILPGTQVLRMALPAYCIEDPTLARVVDEASADVFAHGLDGRTVRDSLPDEHRELPVVHGDATVLEIAALMARTRSPLVAVTAEDGQMVCAVTLSVLMDRVVAA
jgi:CBS domain-containing protein